MEYNVRIDENFLRGDHVDGEVLQHTDLNELENVAKTAINANYEDIQKLQDGTLLIGNSERLDGATLSTFSEETLQNSDTTVPTSMQIKQYVDGAISNIDLGGYYTKRETDTILEGYVKPTDYASAQKGGTIKLGQYGATRDASGFISLNSYSNDDYESLTNNFFISKGTLENVITGKELVNKTYVDDLADEKQNIIFNDYVNVTSANAVNLNTASAGLYHFKNSYIIWGDLDEPQLYDDSLWLVEVYSETFRQLYDITYQTTYNVEKSGNTYSMEEFWNIDNVYFEDSIEDFVSFSDYPNIDNAKAGVVKIDPGANMKLSDINSPTGRGAIVPYYGNSFLSDTQLLKSGNGAPTLGSYEILGSFYQDKSNGNLYQILLDTDGEHWVWKQIATKAYVDGLVGDIGTALDTINGEVI